MKPTSILPLLTMLLSTSVFAKPLHPLDEEFFWVSSSLGSSELQNDEITTNLGLSSEIRGGYKFRKYFSPYFGFTTITNTEIDDIYLAQFGSQLTLPISDQWIGVVTLGFESAMSSEVSHKLNPNYSAGINYQLTPQFGTHLSIDLKKDVPTERDDSDIVSVKLGVNYRFGQS
ncbi:hypothetical protein V9N52_001031 [Vibrio navarrensis]